MTSYSMVQTGNFDPDAKTDVIGFKVDSSGNGSGFVWQGGKPTAAPYVWATSGLKPGGKAIVGDFNGDGLTDVAYVSLFLTSNILTLAVDTWYSTGSSYSYAGNVVVSGGTNGASLPGSSLTSIDNLVVGNFTGSGINSILITQNICGQISNTSQNGNLTISNYMCGQQINYSSSGPQAITGQYFGYTPMSSAPGGATADSIIWRTGDFNSDGITDVVMTAFDPYLWKTASFSYLYLGGVGSTDPRSCNCSTISHAPYYGTGTTGSFSEFHADINNDGLSDAIYYFEPTPSSGFELDVALNNDSDPTYSEFNTPAAQSFTVSGTLSYAPVNLDLNGDGYGDIALVSQGTSSISVIPLISTGTQFVSGGSNLSLTATSAPKKTLAGDYNGDGLDDVLVITANNGSSSLNAFSFSGLQQARVNKITDGLGSYIGITYSPLSNSAVYSNDGYVSTSGSSTSVGYPYAYFTSPQYVVSQTNSTNPTYTDHLISYMYSDSRINLGGRGLLGFAGKNEIDNTSGITKDDIYCQDFPYTGMVKSSSVYAGTLAVSSDSITVFGNTASTYGSYFPYATSTSHTTDEISSGTSQAVFTTTTSGISYDTDGNLKGSTATTVAANGSGSYTTQTVNQYSDNTNLWFLGRLSDQLITYSDSTGNPAITHERSYAYDPNTGLLTQEKIEPNDAAYLQETDYTRDAFGNILVTKISGPDIATRTTTDTYSPTTYYARFKTSSCNALNQCDINRTYDPATGNLTSDTDPNGLVFSYTYDTFGRSTGGSINQSGLSVSVSITQQTCSAAGTAWCDSANIPTAIYGVETTDSSGEDSISLFDVNERPVGKRRLLGDGSWTEEITKYDADGRIGAISSPFLNSNGAPGYWTTINYDSINRKKLVTAPWNTSNPTGSVTQYSYNGLTTTTTDANQHVTIRTLNALGRLISVEDNDDSTLTYGYDAVGNLTSTLDQNNNEISIKYDVRDHKTQLTDPNSGTWHFTPDTLGEVISQTDPKNQTIYTVYDALGRITNRQDVEFYYAWTYDTLWKGALTEEEQYDNYNNLYYTRAFTYWPFGGVKTDHQFGGTFSYTTQYAFDNQGRVNQLTYPSGFSTAIQYTNGFESLIYAPGNTASFYWRGDHWDNWGQVSHETFGGTAPVITQTARDPAVGQIATILAGPSSGTAIENLSYAWDPNYNITSREDGNLNNQQETFTYDAVDRLNKDIVTNPASGTTNLTLTLDNLGDISRKSDIGSYSYTSAAPHAVTNAGNLGYSYDGNGNMTQVANIRGNILKSYVWNSNNLPTTLSTSSNGSSNFLYGPEQDKILQTAFAPSGSYTNIFYPADGLEEQAVAATTTTHDYIVAPTGMIGMMTQATGQASQVTYFNHDNLGSINAISNSSGSLLQRIAYDTFGNRSIVSSTIGTGFGSDQGYTGQLELDNLSLVHLNGRIYDPTIGRFLSADPFVPNPGNLQSLNRYSYTSNNPLTRTDPSGFDDGGIIVTGGGGTIVMPPPSDPPSSGPPSSSYMQGYTPSPYAIGAMGALFAIEGNLAHPVVSSRLGGDWLFGYFDASGTYGSDYFDQMVFDGFFHGDSTYGSDLPSGTSAGEGTQGLIDFGKFASGAETTAWRNAFLRAGAAEGVGLGPEDPVADLIAGGILTAAAVQASQPSIDRMTQQIQGIMAKTRGPYAEQYALVATRTGQYSNARGGSTTLNAGDVYKYGKSINGSGRYPASFYSSLNLQYETQFVGNEVNALIQEQFKLWSYFIENGQLPPGNAIFK